MKRIVLLIGVVGAFFCAGCTPKVRARAEFPSGPKIEWLNEGKDLTNFEGVYSDNEGREITVTVGESTSPLAVMKEQQETIRALIGPFIGLAGQVK